MAGRIQSGRAYICENLSFAAKEAYKKLRVNLMISLDDRENSHHVIGITSAQPSEGKSTTSINLAYAVAETGKRVLLIDSDMRRPSLHVKMDLEHTPGLSNLLSSTNDISSVIKTYSDVDQVTSFDVITGGEIPENPSELLNSQRMVRLLEALRQSYDLIILDLPPVGAVIDAVTAARNMDGMIVVIRENNCPRQIFTDAVEQLKFAKIKILGIVVNGSTEAAGKKYSYSKYGYGYGYGYGEKK